MCHPASRENFSTFRSNANLLTGILINGSPSHTREVRNQGYALGRKTKHIHIILKMGKLYKQVNIRKNLQMVSEHMKMIGHFSSWETTK